MQGLIYPKRGAQKMELQLLGMSLGSWAKANGVSLDKDAHMDLMMPGLASLGSGGGDPQPVSFTCDMDRATCIRTLRASLARALVSDVIVYGTSWGG